MIGDGLVEKSKEEQKPIESMMKVLKCGLFWFCCFCLLHRLFCAFSISFNCFFFSG